MLAARSRRERGARLGVALPRRADRQHDEHQPVEERADERDRIGLGPGFDRGRAQDEIEGQHEPGDDGQPEVGDESGVHIPCERPVGEREVRGQREDVLDDLQPVHPERDGRVADAEEE